MDPSLFGWIVAAVLAAVAFRLHHAARMRREQLVEQTRDLIEDLLQERPVAIAASPTEVQPLAVDLERVAAFIQRIRRDRSVEATNLQTILSTMQEGLMVIDRQHIIRLINPSFEKLLDQRTSPVGQTVLCALRKVDFEELVTAALNSHEPQHAEIAVGSGRQPTLLAMTATAMRNAQGEANVLLIGRDITRLKQLEDVRREFVANVSHELRTPLAIFQGYLETLLDHPSMPEKELVGILEVLKKHSTRLNLLVEDLLIIARLESRRERLNVEPIEPRSLIEDMVSDWTAIAAKKDIELRAETELGAPEFEADAFRIEQVMNNLVENAIKYTDAGGSVVVRALACEAGIEIRVEDTGIGLTPQDLPHIFERFYRADKSRAREQGGTGLGLSIVKHLAGLHGGTVHAESTYGKGTAIILRLPLLQPGSTDDGGPESGSEREAKVYSDQD